MLKYLLTWREKGGWCSSLMEGLGAQAPPHTTTAVQSRKSMESRRKCASTVKTCTPPVAASLQTSELCWDTGTLGPRACRGGTQLSWAHTFAVLAHRGPGAAHPSRTPRAPTPPCDTGTCCHNKRCLWGEKAPGPNATHAMHPLQLSDKPTYLTGTEEQ